jgi:hypothetical protein
MAERAVLVVELKRALRERGLTYVAVARALSLSLATVKRLFARGDFSLQRFETVCELTGLSMRELLERAEEHAAPTKQLSVTQEREIVADPRLFLVTWLVLNRTPFEEILRAYRFTGRELLRCFLRLDRLKVIELQPLNRVRLLVSRRFSWRAGGPVQRYLHRQLLREFMASHFVGAAEEFVFHGAKVSREVLAQLKRVQQNAARECMELIEQDRSAPQVRVGAAFVLALRAWSYSGFAQFERREAPRAQ